MAYELEGQPSGVGRYLEGLLGGLLETDDAREWCLFMKGDPFEHPLFGTEGRGGARMVPIFDGRPGARPILWEQTRLPGLMRKAKVDFVFSPGYSLPPLVGVPRMVTLHDLSFEHLPEEFGWREGWRRRQLARLAARRAQRVLADTHAIARDLEQTYALAPERIGVVPLAVDDKFFAAAEMAATAAETPPALVKLGIRPPYLLFLATLLPRRRLNLVFDAFGAAARQHPDLELVIAGRDRLRDEGAVERWRRGCGAGDRVRRIDYVPEPVLPQLYAHAEASFYLSTYEGYGLPPLESLAAGRPAIVSSGLALDDLWPEYPYRTALDPESVGNMTRRLLADPERDVVVSEARRRLRAQSWRVCAERFRVELDRAFTATGQPAGRRS